MNEITHHDILNAVSGIFGCLDLITGPASEAERDTLLSEIRNRTTTIHGHILFTWDYQNVGVKAPAMERCEGSGHFRCRTLQSQPCRYTNRNQ